MVDVLKAALPGEAGSARTDSGTPAIRGNMEQAWLRELERAQWSQQRVVAPAPGGATREGAPAVEKEALRAGVHPSLRGPGAEAPGARARPLDGARTPQAGRNAITQLEGAPRSQQRAAAVAQRQAESTSAPERESSLETMIETRLWGEARVWERRKAFVLERGGRVRVWLRDAAMSPESAQDAVACLARLMRESRLELEAVTINGRVVFEAGDGERGARNFD